ncbi:RNA polymerase sigma factor [Agromyces aureus]|uniref:RNA polymerase subunit sigma-24 n=1 Tax=Agromyces aureus TaxID=453304 RepID=A0A191WKE3_9MICO|nr:sigma-70 family RNA polymerase sigma factor [Agromyces aureus]ANJ28654.1 RNA polymerase subunit sigma-24 [Agromyces aureus]
MRGDAPDLARDTARDAVDRIYREEWTRIVATLIRATRDWDLAEDAAADAFVRAAERWPVEGVPDNPGAWLTTVARNRALDVLRRRGVEIDKVKEWMVMDELLRPGAPTDPADLAAASISASGSATAEIDDRLRLIFTCAHPALPIEARVALTLRTVGGLETPEIARAFLVPEATMAQRLVRAKRKIRNAGIPYRVPEGDELRRRLSGVLAVLMLVHNEGYLASSGDRLLRLDLQEEAIRLARLVARLMPDEPEAAGLLALLLLQHARSAARVDAEGELVPLDAQDRTTWNAAEIAEGLAVLDRLDQLDRLPVTGRAGRPDAERTGAAAGPYRLQAEIQREHARAAHPDDTDWAAIVRCYDDLLALTPSPVIELNRAVAVGLAGHPRAGLDALDLLAASGTLDRYHLLPAAQADLLRRLGRADVAADRYRQAIELAPTEPERRFLERRLAELARGVD